jgi:hypothetical protein
MNCEESGKKRVRNLSNGFNNLITVDGAMAELKNSHSTSLPEEMKNIMIAGIQL